MDTMRNTAEPMPLADAVPKAYHDILYWRVTEKPSRRIVVQARARVSFFLFGLLFASLAISPGKLPLSGSFALGLRERGARRILLGLALSGCGMGSLATVGQVTGVRSIWQRMP
jgi:hypothetical protein